MEHKHGIPRGVAEEPVVDIPEDIDGHPVHQDSSVAPELPLQPSHLHDDLVVYADHQGWVTGPAGVAFDRHVMSPAPVGELGLRPVRLLPEYVLPLRHQDGAAGGCGGRCVNLLARLLLHVPEKQDQLPLEGDSQIEPFRGLGALPESRVTEIPVYIDSAGARIQDDLCVSVPSSLGEQPRLDVDFTQGLVGRIVDCNTEALTHQASCPSDGDQARLGAQFTLVDAGDEVLGMSRRNR